MYDDIFDVLFEGLADRPSHHSGADTVGKGEVPIQVEAEDDV